MQGKFQYGIILNLWYGYNSWYIITTATIRALSTCRKQINKNACAYVIDWRIHSKLAIELGNAILLMLPVKIQDQRVKGYVCQNKEWIFPEEIKKKMWGHHKNKDNNKISKILSK